MKTLKKILVEVKKLEELLDANKLSEVGTVPDILICYIISMSFKDVDMSRLKQKIAEDIYKATPFKDIASCMKSIEDIYNYRLSYDKKVYFHEQFKKREDERRSTSIKLSYARRNI